MEKEGKKIVAIIFVLVGGLVLGYFLFSAIFGSQEGREEELPKPPEEVEVQDDSQVDTGGDLFVAFLGIEEYDPETEPREGFKFVSIEAEFTNKGKEAIPFGPYSGWSLVTEDNQFYSAIYPWETTPPAPALPEVRKPVLSIHEEMEGMLPAGDSVIAYISFEIPEGVSVKEATYRGTEKETIFSIDQ